MATSKNDALKQKLAAFSSSDDIFCDPFKDDDPDLLLDKPEILDEIEEKRSKKKIKKKKQDKLERFLEKSSERLDEFDDELASSFDSYVDSLSLDDEDVALKNTLVSLGRKYARETSVSEDTSEITKAFSGSEKKLAELVAELDRDKKAVQEDINNIRATRRNSKIYTELLSAKNQYHNTTLAAVKELNAIKKTMFDLKNKAAAKKAEADAAGDGIGAANATLQGLFRLGRSNLLPDDGYVSVSGSTINDGTDMESEDDELVQKKYFSNDTDTESDGDKFLKYEGKGITPILIINADGSKDIIAEDEDGAIIPDYPIPENPDDMSFEIDRRNKTATDAYMRSYKVRIEETDID